VGTIDGGGRWRRYLPVRGEILGPGKDHHQRKHSPSTPPSIKNESRGIEDDQIPS
jgi:hypothetical protein